MNFLLVLLFVMFAGCAVKVLFDTSDSGYSIVGWVFATTLLGYEIGRVWGFWS